MSVYQSHDITAKVEILALLDILAPRFGAIVRTEEDLLAQIPERPHHGCGA